MAKVLVVDDEKFMRLTITRILENYGHEVIGEAGTGIEAISKYSQLKPDLVTLDITMPDMDGIQTLSKIRCKDPNVKVVMVSAMSQQTMVKQALENGAVDFVVKPFQPERVELALQRVLGR